MAEYLTTLAEQPEALAEHLTAVAEHLETLAEYLMPVAERLEAVGEGVEAVAEAAELLATLLVLQSEEIMLPSQHHSSFCFLLMAVKRLRPIFTCRFDEVAPLARLLWASYQRDRDDFVDLLPDDYNAAFDADFAKKLGAVEKLVASSVQQAKGMAVTAEIEALYDALPELLNRLEARVRRADGLTVPAKKFGIADARDARNQDDKEDLAGDLNTLLQNIAANKDALETKGQKAADTKKIQDLYDALVRNSTAQGTNTSTQRQLTQANVQTINELETLMQHVFDDGKSLYERRDKTRLKDYTYKQLLKLVRRERAGDADSKAS